ncbi:heterokaryon incompatibility protein-domain-containing protein [Hypoxylon fuscum]|nr:heterokaryon incompatibility protein-domain-containing protein [Hypoxylon fuscum]
MDRTSEAQLGGNNLGSSHSYLYTALPAGKWFRLVRLYPGGPKDTLECAIETFELHVAPSYIALSYVWGDTTQCTQITCSGRRIPITLNLHHSLRRLRKPDQEVWVWVDAICIDQTNNLEKGHQVNLMGTIYEDAEYVIVWLGEDIQGNATLAFQTLVDVSSIIQSRSESHSFTSRFQPATFSHERDFFETRLNMTHIQSVEALYQNPWFTRVWVLQEVGLAKKAVAIWGSSAVDFSEIALFIYFSVYVPELTSALGHSLVSTLRGTPYHALWNVWCTYGKGTWVENTPFLKSLATWIITNCNVDFVMLLEASKQFQATNPLDHVYAFLGHPKAILPETNEPLWEADYSMELPELHYIVACQLARSSLNFLVQVQYSVGKDFDLHIQEPSWIPRWNIHVSRSPHAFWEAWDASLRVISKRPPESHIIGDELVVSGLLIDFINFHSHTFECVYTSSQDKDMWTWIETCWDLTRIADNIRTHIYEDMALAAFASTLCCVYRDLGTINEWAAWFCDLCCQQNPLFFAEKLSHHARECDRSSIPRPEGINLLIFIKHYCEGRCFFTTKEGRWGLGPPLSRPGDICAILFGADVPFILRPQVKQGHYKLVGQGYIYGVMYGEAVEMWESNQPGIQKVDITLI